MRGGNIFHNVHFLLTPAENACTSNPSRRGTAPPNQGRMEMFIAADMNLSDLAERMGDIATDVDARAMRDLLVERYEGQDTADIPESDWLAMLEEALA